MKKKNTYPPLYTHCYQVRYTQTCGQCGKPQYTIAEFSNKKEATKFLNKLKRFVESHKKDIITVEEIDWGLMYFTVGEVLGLYKISYVVDKIK